MDDDIVKIIKDTLEIIKILNNFRLRCELLDNEIKKL